MQYEHPVSGNDTFSLSTNIGDLIKAALKRAVARYLQQAQAAIEKALRERIDSYLTGKWVSREEVDLIFAAAKGDRSAVDSLKTALEAKRTEAERKLRGAAEEAVEEVKAEAKTQVEDAAKKALGGFSLPF
jgi:BMFP domain-containing protein YqiC